MKKLLSILGAVGLVATASTAVVACGSSNVANNPSHSYSDFQGWVNETKQNYSSDLIFIGGRKDVDTLSWLAARQYVSNGKNPVNTTDVNALVNTSNVDSADAKFSTWASDTSTIPGQTFSQAKATNKSDGTQNDQNNSSLVKNYFWDDNSSQGKTEKPINPKVTLHSIIVDDVSTFFTSGVGKSITDGLVKDQASTLNNWWWGPQGENSKDQGKDWDKTKKGQISKVTKQIANLLTSSKGPYFLLISNGKIAGITNGYKNYTDFDKTITSLNPSAGTVSSQAPDDINALFTYFGDKIFGNLYDWLNNNWAPNTTASNIVIDDSKINNWNAIANTGKTYDGNKAGSKTTQNYVIDPRKYID